MKNQIYNNVIEAMQEAEELGGVNDLVEYVELMKAISEECLARIDVALINATDDEIQKISA